MRIAMTEPIPSIEPDVPGRNGRRGLLLRAPYRTALVTQLKDGIPRAQRYWDDGVNAWWIDSRAQRRAEDIVLKHFGRMAVLGMAGEAPVLLTSAAPTAGRG